MHKKQCCRDNTKGINSTTPTKKQGCENQSEGFKEVRTFAKKIILNSVEASMNPTSEELAKVILYRVGLMPRKKGATEKMFHTFLELYERAKSSYRDKKPEKAVMTVEEMGLFAGITRQTMYDYLGRWLELGLIQKASYIKDDKVVIGYKLAGNTLESAFEKAMQKINGHMDITVKYVAELQKLIKNEKISISQKMRAADSEVAENEPEDEESTEEGDSPLPEVIVPVLSAQQDNDNLQQ